MKENLYLFKDEKIKIEVHTENDKKMFFTFPLKYVVSEMLNFLCKNHSNWTRLKARWKSWDSPIGMLYNNKEIEKLKNRTIVKHDWIYYADNDHVLLAVIYFKNSLQRIEVITKKSDLVNNFISKLYQKFGHEWDRFDTYYLDTGDVAYYEFYNTPYRKKNPRISPMTLASRVLSSKIEKKKKGDSFYILRFKNRPFFKIGYSSNFKFRLYNYIFPASSSEIELYKNSVIDFSKSFVIKTKKAKSIEKFLKKELKQHVFENSINSKEIFHSYAYDLLDNLIESEKKITLKKITGLSNSMELKSLLSLMGIHEKASAFFSKGKANSPLNFDF